MGFGFVADLELIAIEAADCFAIFGVDKVGKTEIESKAGGQPSPQWRQRRKILQ